MLFDKNEYYKYINNLKTTNTIIYVIIIGLSILLGIASGIITLIITVPIGILIAYLYTISRKIKIQKMNWEIDMYEMMKEKTDK